MLGYEQSTFWWHDFDISATNRPTIHLLNVFYKLIKLQVVKLALEWFVTEVGRVSR